MRPFDTLPVVVLFAGVASLVLGEIALGRSEDLRAMYCLALGASSLRAAVAISRAGMRRR